MNLYLKLPGAVLRHAEERSWIKGLLPFGSNSESNERNAGSVTERCQVSDGKEEGYRLKDEGSREENERKSHLPP